MREGWEKTTLGKICEKPSNIKWANHIHENFEYIDLSSVSRESLSITETSSINSTNAPSRAKKIVYAGDIIFATTRPTLKRATIINQKYHNQICSTGYSVLRPIKGVALSGYIYYFILSEDFMRRMESLQRGASYPAVSDKDVLKTSLFLPSSILEQKQIVAILDKAFAAIDQAKANIEKNIANAKELFQSKLNEIFSQKGEGWEEKTLKEISIDFGRGKSKNRPRNDKKLFGGKYPFVQTGDIRNSDKFLKTYSQTYNEIGLSQSKLWPKGTICITIAANIAETAILEFDSCFPDSMIGLVVDRKKADSNYTYYSLQFLKRKLQELGKGSAQDNINLGTFQKQYFPFPSIEKQKEIVFILDNISEQTIQIGIKYKQKLLDLEELKKSILQKAFAGELTMSELMIESD